MIRNLRIANSILFTAIVLVIGLFSVSSQKAQAEDLFGNHSKWGIEVDRLQNGGSDYGVLMGFRHVGYFQNSSTYLGVEVHTGTDRSGNLGSDNLTYGGLTLGFDGNYAKAITYDLNCLVGYGFGSVTRDQLSGQSLAIEPQISLGLIMLSGYRASFNAGYLFMPAAGGFSTWVFGIRLDHKSISSSAGLSD